MTSGNMKLECVIYFMTNGQVFIIPQNTRLVRKEFLCNCAINSQILSFLCWSPPSNKLLVRRTKNGSYIRALTYFIRLARPSLALDSVVQKEALYCAIGRCAIRLKNVLQFDVWLQNTFFQEAHDTNPMSVFHQTSPLSM
jgi:hypothetical protein